MEALFHKNELLLSGMCAVHVHVLRSTCAKGENVDKVRVEELCESRGGRPGLPVFNLSLIHI